MAPEIKIMNSKNSYSLDIVTRYAETDQMGYIHHSVYPVYLEYARIEWMKQIGISYKSLEANGILLPVRTMKIKYIIPLTFDEKIQVKVKVKKPVSVKLIFQYEIFNEKGEKSTEAEVELFFAGKNGKPMRPPREIVDKFDLL